MTAHEIKTAFDRNAKAVALRRSVGQGTAVTRVRLIEGLACEVSEGPWTVRVDASAKSGGTDTGPNPGILGRGALGSCLAIGYAMWAASLGVPISALEVEIQADYDSAGMYGVAEAQPGYREVRYLVTIQSEASEADVLRVIDMADAHSPYRDVFARAQTLRRDVRIVAHAH